MEVLVSFEHDTYYGSVNGIYVMTVEEYEKIKFLQEEGCRICLGEVAGKHSHVYTDADNFILISKNEDEIETFKSLFGRTFGSYSPFDYAMELYEDMTYNEDDEEDEE